MAELLAGVGGASSVITLLDACLKLYDLVERGRTYGKDFEKLLIKLDVERLRLLTWGLSFGFWASDAKISQKYHEKLDIPRIQATIIGVLCGIKSTFEDTGQLIKRYGMKPLNDMQTMESTAERNRQATMFEQSFRKFQARVSLSQKHASLAETVHWAVRDCQKFNLLVHDLREYNDSLEKIAFSLDRLRLHSQPLLGFLLLMRKLSHLQILQRMKTHSYTATSQMGCSRFTHVNSKARIHHDPITNVSLTLS